MPEPPITLASSSREQRRRIVEDFSYTCDSSFLIESSDQSTQQTPVGVVGMRLRWLVLIVVNRLEAVRIAGKGMIKQCTAIGVGKHQIDPGGCGFPASGVF